MSPTTKNPKPIPAAPKPKPAPPNTELSQAEAKSNRQYIIGMVVISTIILIIGGFFIYRLFKDYWRKTNEIKAQNYYIDALKDKKEALIELKPNYEQITAKQASGLSIADVVFRALPKTAEYKSLIGVIENIAKESGVKESVATSSSKSRSKSFSTSNSSTVTTGSKPEPFEITVTINGQYDQLLTFLRKTETSLRPINFKSMDISGSSGSGTQPVQATIVFETYYQGLADIANKEKTLNEVEL